MRNTNIEERGKHMEARSELKRSHRGMAQAAARLAFAVCVAAPLGAHAREAVAPPAATASAPSAPDYSGVKYGPMVKTRCADGDYRGPEPGKKQWVKDDYTWAVSREFAKRYCMPEAMVSDELKGAEAVAFRVKPSDEATCRMENAQEVCRRQAELQLELYLRSDLNLPKSHPEVRFYQRPRVVSDSGQVIQTVQASKNGDRRRARVWTDPPGQLAPFHVFNGDDESRKVKFMHVEEFDDSNLAAAGADFIESYYQTSWVDGIDLIRLGAGPAMGLGTMSSPGARKQGIGVIRDRDLPGCGSCEEKRKMTRNRYVHVIEFPRWLNERIYAYDKQQGDLFIGSVKRVLGVPGSPPAPKDLESPVPPVTR
jgi:hypothetical protein